MEIFSFNQNKTGRVLLLPILFLNIRNDYYLMESFNAFPGLNLATLDAGILMTLPSRGFLPFLSARLLTENVPKPTKVTFSPFFKAVVTPSVKPFKAFSEATLLIPDAAAILPTSSAFVIIKPS